uniref:Uncharacterized protein n=1 Tax=Chromera velia CCMP2878 TaxID=1169474 RepID=A0A0G4F149_9ALVE|eukprot:Cvel_2590.t1-p1 / transcript=Cvel_2590.t1 / gene=Cvel_2590 / organism=Chromera_velia_CCMP2878 / gene_product=hypothetical protein / transcript_product=hypothetical protein / location=Cvel_scaffold102:106718-107581(-) / protein_length=288 / sequence_SO=supercontig / SO=protein_coding / is_pseudo=false
MPERRLALHRHMGRAVRAELPSKCRNVSRKGMRRRRRFLPSQEHRIYTGLYKERKVSKLERSIELETPLAALSSLLHIRQRLLVLLTETAAFATDRESPLPVEPVHASVRARTGEPACLLCPSGGREPARSSLSEVLIFVIVQIDHSLVQVKVDRLGQPMLDQPANRRRAKVASHFERREGKKVVGITAFHSPLPVQCRGRQHIGTASSDVAQIDLHALAGWGRLAQYVEEGHRAMSFLCVCLRAYQGRYLGEAGMFLVFLLDSNQNDNRYKFAAPALRFLDNSPTEI